MGKVYLVPCSVSAARSLQHNQLMNTQCEGMEAGRICPACNQPFHPTRSNMKFCSPRCRKNRYSRADRNANPRNSTHSPAKWRENMELFDRHRCLVELLIKQRTHEDRNNVIRQIIDAAENGHRQLRTILTSKAFQFPNPNRKLLFFPIHKNSKTIAQMANAYSWKTWGCSLENVLNK